MLAAFLQGNFTAASAFDLQDASSRVTQLTDQELLLLAATTATAMAPPNP